MITLRPCSVGIDEIAEVVVNVLDEEEDATVVNTLLVDDGETCEEYDTV